MSDLKSTESCRLFQTLTIRCPKKETCISMIGLFVKLTAVTSSDFFH